MANTPVVRRAVAAYVSASHKLARPPRNITPLERLTLKRRRDDCRRALYDQRREEKLNECASFFERINDFQPQVCLRRTFTYIKRYKRAGQRSNAVYK